MELNWWILFLIQGTLATTHLCYRCVNFECDGFKDDSNLCTSAHNFVQTSLKSFYQIGSFELPKCPDPLDELGWEILKTVEPNPAPCQGPCTLGRFQVNSSTQYGGGSVMNFGTVLGCPTPKLWYDITHHVPRFHSISSTEKRTCRFDNVSSTERFKPHLNIHNSMFLEHCNRLGDVCDRDFCLDPRGSIVIPFHGGVIPYDHAGIIGFVFWITWFGIIVGIIIAIVSFLGMKYDA